MRVRGRYLGAVALVVACIVVAATAALSSGKTNPSGSSETGKLAHYSSSAMSFSYPASWHLRTHRLIVLTSHGTDIVALSTQPMHNACKSRRLKGGGVSVDCLWPISHLKRDSMLAILYLDYWQSPTFRALPGKKIEVDGKIVKWDEQPVGKREGGAAQPGGLGATMTVDAYAKGRDGSWFDFGMLVRGPDTAALIHQFRAVIQSIHWPKVHKDK